MLMVIFGAGASYDSDPSRPAGVSAIQALDRLPLANELFDNRQHFAEDLSHFRDCRPIVPYLRRTDAIEAQLERLLAEANEKPPYPKRLRQLASVRWYFQYLLNGCDRRWSGATHGITNYLTLLDQIARWGNRGVLLVTFNYDRLLEWAVRDITGASLTRVEDYIASEMFPVIKLHGSVNWGRVLHNPPLTTTDGWLAIKTAIEKAATLKVSQDYVVSEDRPLWRDASSRYLFPAIAIPVQSKQQFECPESHLTFLRDRLPAVRRVLVVGWRGMDGHFVKLLKDTLGAGAVQFQIVSKDAEDSKTLAKLLSDAGILATFQPLGYSFSEYVTKRAGDEFFRRQ